jgi:AraC-like DNA-binding protein
VGISLSRLQHAFKETYGITPGALLRRLRLQMAARLLRSNPEYSIGEVAERSGHGSPTAFGAAFKRAYGVSPLRFRQGRAAVTVPA